MDHAFNEHLCCCHQSELSREFYADSRQESVRIPAVASGEDFRGMSSDYSDGIVLINSKAMFAILEADIVVMQETKIQRKDLRDDMVLVPGWDVYFSLPKHKKGLEYLMARK